ncbi:MAG TPA: 3-hydroxybutyryl-CoA dehydrogenase [Vicinamibacteria bacterium]|jgi:3-hydroxybutyryl-CoA dehydrogenase|nr:3-hydroxybutyryl-CoA dehydrogenase [Vicinamibacteria bacterium]
MAIQTVGVVGCGLMGSGIAQVCAEAGHSVVVREVSEDLLRKGLGRIESFLAKGVEKGKVTRERKAEVMGRLKGTTELEELRRSDIVIEAVVENLEAKRELFSALDGICPERTIFASNTSSLSITEMAAVTRRPARFVGLHFFNPVPLMKLVEVVRSPLTAPDCVDEVVGFARGLGKTPIRATDRGGFIVNRLLVPYLLDAIRALEEGVGSTVDIDEGMRLGCGHPMGPLTLLDFVGLDTTYSIANIMFDEFREKRFAPPPLLKRMVQAGLYGRKSGKGFYDYSQDPPKPLVGLV